MQSPQKNLFRPWSVFPGAILPSLFVGTASGTPVLEITDNYDPEQQAFTLTVKQSTPATPEQSEKESFHIPLAVGLLDSKTGADILNPPTKILHIKNPSESFQFQQIKQRPVPSLLRNFSRTGKSPLSLQ